MEVLAPPPATAPRIAASEELGALPLFQLYAAHVGMPDAGLQAGTAILQVKHQRPLGFVGFSGSPSPSLFICYSPEPSLAAQGVAVLL